MLQKLALITPKALSFKKKTSYFLLCFACTFIPTLIVLFFSLLVLEGTQKSQLVLLSFAALLFSVSALKFLLSGLGAKVVREECRRFEDTAEVTHRQEVERYRDKLKEYENSCIEMQAAYDQKIVVLHNANETLKSEVEALNFQMEKKLDEMRLAYFEFEDMRKEMTRLEEELKYVRVEAEEKLQRKEVLMSDYQHTIYEQRQVLEKKQHYIGKLEVKVRDLMYEIRTLLQLEEQPLSDPNIDLGQDAQALADYYLPKESSTVKNFDITMQLERYLEQAERFTGADHLGYRGGKEPRFADLSQSGYQIDLRRFFDHLRDESSAVIFFFSLQERRFLFVNNYVKTLLGHSPEKFIYKFNEMVEGGYQQWGEALLALDQKSPARVRLLMRTKEGEKVVLSCQMSMIKEGPFRGHVIGILAPHPV